MRYTGPRNRLSRREGIDLGLKTPGSKSHASLLKKINVLPGQHGTKGRKKTSEHARQLREKQKLRFTFGVTASQLKNYFAVASKRKGNTGILLSELLERRLDNIVYRLGFAPTRAAARQLISHKHIQVNNRIVNIASYQVKEEEIIGFVKDASKKIPAVEISLAKDETFLPAWLAKEKNDTGKLTVAPTSEIIEKQINLRLVVEFFSR
jgi:small subunit ribosomal protein S4